MNTGYYQYTSNTFTGIASRAELNMLMPSDGLFTVACSGKLKLELSANGGMALFVAFCPENGTIHNIRVNNGYNVKIINLGNQACDIYTSLVVERPQIQMQWNP